MEEVKLVANVRRVVKKGENHKLRRMGFFPAIVYGDNESSSPIQVSQKDFFSILHTDAKENVLINLNIPELKGKTANQTVMIKEIQLHPIKKGILHVDFYRISLKEKIETTVELKFIGESKGVKEGGILERFAWGIKIRSLPTNIPPYIELNIEELKIDDIITMGDISLPEGVELVESITSPIASIILPKEITVEEEELLVASEEEKEPEVIRKGKKEET